MVDGVSAAVARGFGQGTGPLEADGFDIIGTGHSLLAWRFLKSPTFSLKAIPLALIVVVYWFLAFAAITVMFSVYLVSYITTSFLIGFGPVFIALYFFPYTRRLFDGWASVVMTGVLVQIFTVGLGAMFIFVLGNIITLQATGLKGSQIAQVDGGIVIGQMMMLVATALVCQIFGIVSVAIGFIGARIAGGVYSEITRLQTTRNAPPPPPPPPPGNTAIAHGGAVGGDNQVSSPPGGGVDRSANMPSTAMSDPHHESTRPAHAFGGRRLHIRSAKTDRTAEECAGLESQSRQSGRVE